MKRSKFEAEKDEIGIFASIKERRALSKYGGLGVGLILMRCLQKLHNQEWEIICPKIQGINIYCTNGTCELSGQWVPESPVSEKNTKVGITDVQRGKKRGAERARARK